MLALCVVMLIPTISFGQSLGERLAGKLLLQVEQAGRIWYVGPEDNKRYEVTFANALPLFQQHSLGITDADLAKIPVALNSLSNDVDSDNDGNSDHTELKNGYNPFGPGKATGTTTFGKRFNGHLLLQVQQGGRIWYVDFDGYRWEVTWDNLMNLFKKLSLGITNKDLNQIPTATATGATNSSSESEPDDDPDYDENDYSSHDSSSSSDNTSYNNTYTAPSQPTQPVNTYSPPATPVVNKPGLLMILEDFDALSGTQMAQIYNSLGQNDILTLSIYEAFGGLMHYKMCTEVPNQIYQSASRGMQDCNTTTQLLQNSLQFISLESMLQNADTERLAMLNANNCATGKHDAATCSMYANATQNMNTMQQQTFERVNMNLNNQCYVGVDAGCEYYNTY